MCVSITHLCNYTLWVNLKVPQFFSFLKILLKLNPLPVVEFASSGGAELTNHVSLPQETLDLDVLLALLALTCLATSFTTQSHGLGCLGNRRRSTSSYLL